MHNKIQLYPVCVWKLNNVFYGVVQLFEQKKKKGKILVKVEKYVYLNREEEEKKKQKARHTQHIPIIYSLAVYSDSYKRYCYMARCYIHPIFILTLFFHLTLP